MNSNRSLLSGWDLTINSSFKDLREGVQLTKEESVFHYCTYYFQEKEETTTKSVPFALQRFDQPMLKCSTKKPKNNLRAMLMKGKAPNLSKPKYPQTGKLKQSFASSFCDNEGEDMSATNNNDGSDIEDITADADISHTENDDMEKETIDDEEEENEEDEVEINQEDEEDEEDEEEDEELEFEDFNNDCEEGEIVSCSNTKKRPANKIKKEQISMKYMKAMK